jgi:predicted dehydrogenase
MNSPTRLRRRPFLLGALALIGQTACKGGEQKSDERKNEADSGKAELTASYPEGKAETIAADGGTVEAGEYHHSLEPPETVARYTLRFGSYPKAGSSAPNEEGQVQVVIDLLGKKGSAKGDPLEPGNYGPRGATNDKYLVVSGLQVVVFEGDSPVYHNLDPTTMTGRVEIESVDGRIAKGTVDAKSPNPPGAPKEGDIAVKGAFAAKFP